MKWCWSPQVWSPGPSVARWTTPPAPIIKVDDTTDVDSMPGESSPSGPQSFLILAFNATILALGNTFCDMFFSTPALPDDAFQPRR